MDFGQAHENHLAARYWTYADVWCSNKACDNHDVATSVRFESEYGQGRYLPEECDRCGSEWLDEPPQIEEEEEE